MEPNREACRTSRRIVCHRPLTWLTGRVACRFMASSVSCAQRRRGIAAWAMPGPASKAYRKCSIALSMYPDVASTRARFIEIQAAPCGSLRITQSALMRSASSTIPRRSAKRAKVDLFPISSGASSQDWCSASSASSRRPASRRTRANECQIPAERGSNAAALRNRGIALSRTPRQW